MAPRRKATSRNIASKKPSGQTDERIATKIVNTTSKSVIARPQTRKACSDRKRKDLAANQTHLNTAENGSSNINSNSMSISSGENDSVNPELSLSNSCVSTTSDDPIQPNNNPGVHFNIEEEDDEDHQFQTMFMPDRASSNSRPNIASTPLIYSQQQNLSNGAAIGTRPSYSMSQDFSNSLSTAIRNHRSSTQDSSFQTKAKHMNSNVQPGPSLLQQASTGNQSLSSIHYSSNNSAILETFVEYRSLKRELQRAHQTNAKWKADYAALTRRLQNIQNSSFPRPTADGRIFLEQLLESLKTSEQDEDSRTSSQLAKDIGIPEATLLSLANVDPQKTSLRVFNYLFPGNYDKENLISVTNMTNNYPHLLENILVFARRCTPGCGYSISSLKEAIGNSIRCARHKLKASQARFITTATVQQSETNDDTERTEIMSQSGNMY